MKGRPWWKIRCSDCLSLLNWIGVFSLLLKLPLRKFGPDLLNKVSFFFLLHLISLNLTCGFALESVVMSKLMLQIVTWICWISYRKVMSDCWSLLLLLFMDPWFIFCKYNHANCFFKVLVDIQLNWLNWFHFFNLVRGLLVIPRGCIIF